MVKATCQNCQYFREYRWCSNSKSPYNRQDVSPDNTCSEFYQRGKKAPRRIRLANKILNKANQVLKGKR